MLVERSSPTATIRLELSTTTSEREAVLRARRALGAIDELDGNADASFDARLLVSELVANAVTHGANEQKCVHLLAVVTDYRVLRVEVSDGGPGFVLGQDDVKRPDPESSGGRGLYLLQTLADRYGVNDQTRGGLVWFEIDF